MIIGVRRGYHVLNAVFGRHFAHGNGNFPGFRPIVHLGQDVTVNIDHRLDSKQAFLKVPNANLISQLNGDLALWVSFPDKVAYGSVGLAQSFLRREKYSAEMPGPRLLTESRAMYH
jgi:hypothetical protein